MRADDNLRDRADVRGWAGNLREYGIVRFAHEHLQGVADLQRRRDLRPDADLHVDRPDLRGVSRNVSGCAYLRSGSDLQCHRNLPVHADLRRIPDLPAAAIRHN